MAFERAAASPGSSFSTSVVAAAIVAVVALLAWHNSFGVPFVFDDELAIVGNPTVRRWWTSLVPPQEGAMGGLPISGRPVVNVSVAANYALSGTASVGSYHVFNLFVHVAAGCVLCGLVRRTLMMPRMAGKFGAKAWELALLAAVLWTLHPLQTESVTYISQRAEALLGLWYFAAIYCYARAAEPGATGRWKAGVVAACLVGMATKEVMVSAPIFAALYDRAFLAESWRDVWMRRGKLLGAMAATWLLLAWFVAGGGGTRGASAGFGLGVPWWSYLLKQCEAIVLYLKLSLWPHPLVLDYGTGLVWSLGEVWWQAALVTGLLGATVWALRRRPAAGVLGAWFFMILAPSSSVVPLVGQTIAEHRMYLPLAAVTVAAVLGAYAWLGRRALAGLTLVAVALGVATVARNDVYATTTSICEDTVAKRPDNARAMALLADYYHRAGNLAKAREWLERSLVVQPGVAPVLSNLGNVWLELGEAAKAVDCYRQALAKTPRDVNTLNNLGNALIGAGKFSEGIAQLEAAVGVAPNEAGPRGNLAAALAQGGRLAEAAEQFELLVKAHPDEAEARASFANVLLELKRAPEAMAQLEAAVRLRPADAVLRNRYGMVLGRAGRVREALDQFNEALRLNPQLDAARQNAARAERMLGGK